MSFDRKSHGAAAADRKQSLPGEQAAEIRRIVQEVADLYPHRLSLEGVINKLRRDPRLVKSRETDAAISAALERLWRSNELEPEEVFQVLEGIKPVLRKLPPALK